MEKAILAAEKGILAYEAKREKAIPQLKSEKQNKILNFSLKTQEKIQEKT